LAVQFPLLGISFTIVCTFVDRLLPDTKQISFASCCLLQKRSC